MCDHSQRIDECLKLHFAELRLACGTKALELEVGAFFNFDAHSLIVDENKQVKKLGVTSFPGINHGLIKQIAAFYELAGLDLTKIKFVLSQDGSPLSGRPSIVQDQVVGFVHLNESHTFKLPETVSAAELDEKLKTMRRAGNLYAFVLHPAIKGYPSFVVSWYPSAGTPKKEWLFEETLKIVKLCRAAGMDVKFLGADGCPIIRAMIKYMLYKAADSDSVDGIDDHGFLRWMRCEEGLNLEFCPDGIHNLFKLFRQIFNRQIRIGKCVFV